MNATYTLIGDIFVEGYGAALDHYDADGAAWQDEVREILRGHGYEPVGDWVTDPGTGDSTIDVHDTDA